MIKIICIPPPTHFIVTVTSSILSVVMSPVIWCLTAVRVKILGEDLEKNSQGQRLTLMVQKSVHTVKFQIVGPDCWYGLLHSVNFFF